MGAHDYWLLILGAALVNNVVLAKFLGLCPFMGVSGRIEGALGLGLATTLVLTLASSLAWLAEYFVLRPLDAPALRTLTYIFIIAVAVQSTELLMRRFTPLLHQWLGIYVPLITTNCAVLGTALLSSREELTLFGAALFGFASASGFMLVLLMFAALRARIVEQEVPLSWRGTPIALVSAGIMALAFMGLSGFNVA